ncbi:MAG: glycoside hydrolase family 88 protein [Bacillota bacterium]|nr:glycoside hydrolase family 88 protein [Bacillota bacterium]
MTANVSTIQEKELKRRDFILHGNPWKVVFVIAFPLFLYSVLSYFYSIIDTIMCANIGKEAVNAVSALNQVTNMITAVGGGVGAGGSILIAREIGKKNYEKAQTLASTVFAFILIIAVLTCVIVLPLSEPLLRLFAISEESIAVGKGYFMLSVATSSIIMVNTVYLGMEKAKGSTLFITLLNVGVVIVKISLNAIFIYGFQIQDMTFVSLATLIANGMLFLFILARMFSKGYLFHFEFAKLDFQGKTLGRIIFISFPIFVGKFIFSFGKVIINSLCASFGNNVVGALGVSNNMGGSVTNPLSSIEDSTSSIISQNVGAGQIDRAIRTFLIGLAYAAGIAVVGISIVTIFDSQITHYFAQKAGDGIEDPVLAQQAIDEYASLISTCFFYEKMGIFTLGLNSAVLGLLYGFGYTRVSMILNIARVFVFRIPIFLICRYGIFAEAIEEAIALDAAGSSSTISNLDKVGAQVAGISMGFSNIAIGIMAVTAAIICIAHIKNRLKNKEGVMSLSPEKKAEVEGFIDSYLSNYKNYKEEKKDWCYEDGVVLLGSFRLYKQLKDKKYLQFCLNYFDKNIGENGELNNYTKDDHNIDNIQAGTALFLVNNIHYEKKYELALNKLEEQLKEQPRTSNGSFWHKDRYPNQVWLDGLFMGMPFYTLLAEKEHSSKMKNDITDQFVRLDDTNWDPEKKVYLHCYDETKSMQWADPETGRSPHVWLRSVGWLAMASVDVCSIMKDSMDITHINKIKAILKRSIDSMLPYQDPESKMWKDLPCIDDPDNYLEVSGSVMLAYAMMKGARLNLLPYEYMSKGVEAFEGIIKHSFHDGHLNNIVKVSGLDAQKRNGSKEYYLSEPVVADDSKGVGPFMMAYAEYLAMPF